MYYDTMYEIGRKHPLYDFCANETKGAKSLSCNWSKGKRVDPYTALHMARNGTNLRRRTSFGKKDADRMLSRLKVKKSYRRYNDVERELPGAVIRYNDRIGILTGQQNNGFYYIVSGFPEKLKAADCEVLRHNPGIVYM